MHFTKHWRSLLIIAIVPFNAQAEDAKNDCKSDQSFTESQSLDGITIDSVHVNVDPVFTQEQKGPLPFLYDLANLLHISTRTSVIEKDLLFQKGDQINPAILSETERLLRKRRYLSRASVTAKPDCTGNAQVNVDVQDVWTLEPHIQFDRSGADSSFGFGFEETNLFGFGKTLQYSQFSTDERDGQLFKYHDPNTGFLRSTFTAFASDNDDGHVYFAQLTKPFESLEADWSAGVSALDIEQDDILYDASYIFDRYHEQSRALEVTFGKKIEQHFNDKAIRLQFGVSHSEADFTSTNGTQFLTSLPDNYTLSNLWTELQWIHNNYREEFNLESMNRIEDINFGSTTSLRLGTAQLRQNNDSQHYMLFAGQHNKFYQIDKNVFVRLAIAGTTLTDGSSLINGSMGGRIAYFHGQKVFDQSMQFFAEYAEDRVMKPLGHHYLVLGPIEGARGYSARYQTGDHRQVITLEERWHGAHEWFSLFYLGAAVFYDAAHVWGDSPVELSEQGWLQSAGVGLRIMTNRLGGREGGGVSVLHIDLAGPVGSDRNVDSSQILVSVKQGF